jgi:hypothetical protein
MYPQLLEPITTWKDVIPLNRKPRGFMEQCIAITRLYRLAFQWQGHVTFDNIKRQSFRLGLKTVRCENLMIY